MQRTPVRAIDDAHDDFQAVDLAFLGSMLPGIIHNWATPLSGVIGATQLLEGRVSVIHDLLSHFETLTAAERDELQRQLDRNRTNVDILSRNAHHLADLLQVLVQRITRGNCSARDAFPLHELLQNELRFLDANLQFKHKVKKTTILEEALPATAFSYGFVAAFIDKLAISITESHDFQNGQIEMDFSTGVVQGKARISITAHFAPLSSGDGAPDPLTAHLDRLREDGWEVDCNLKPGQIAVKLTRDARHSS
jgi:signal transduction histidine kinase